MSNVYIENDYENRDDYLRCLAEEYGLNLDDVKLVADTLGEEEDFDALVTTLQDM